MARQHGGKRALRAIAPAFTVAAPSGARIRDRLRVGGADEKVLALVGQHLGRYQRADLAERVVIGPVPVKEARRAERKKKLTAVSSSRWAGAMTRASEDQYQLSMRCLYDERAGLRRAIGQIARRLTVPCGQRTGRVRGYQDQGERFQKQRRLQALQARLAVVERRIAEGRPSVVVGGRRLAKLRHHLSEAHLTAGEWRGRWDAARLFLTADGESGAPHGNYTITVDPADGSVTIVLPEPLRHLANAPRGRYRLACTVTFHHRREEWLDRVTANQAVRYDIVRDPVRGRWYLDASWSAPQTMLPSPQEIRAAGGRMLGADLNADHLAAYARQPGRRTCHGAAGVDRRRVPSGRQTAGRRHLADQDRHDARLHGDRGREPGLHRRSTDGPGDDGARSARQGLPSHGGRYPDRQVPGPAARHGLPPGAGRGRRGPGLHLPLGRPALANTSRRSIEIHCHPASCGRGGDWQTRPGTTDPASARCDRSRPEDRTAESYRPDRFHAQAAWDHEPTQDHRHAPPGR
ncbi:hypothetical protein B7755_012375 [Streptomyces sp. NBS 14/10]|uniref:hypothetical protein n=1 Tax=Streptomyces sp. NBS 14/10 TaxID=1945643 RepID=UPI00211AA54C|nr:hypothetical protein [Streptomyces sp. NBS 14/10]KAK1178868.1 hypothetical protein B7755_012375 [Streptomyces sp. NBS 14/10]